MSPMRQHAIISASLGSAAQSNDSLESGSGQLESKQLEDSQNIDGSWWGVEGSVHHARGTEYASSMILKFSHIMKSLSKFK